MYYSQLSMLKHIVTKEEMKKFDNYLQGLSDENNQRITASKVCISTGIDLDVCRKILGECEKNGLLSQKFIVICPKCGGMIKEINKLENINDMTYCYMCGAEDLEISSEDIIIAYALEQEKIPFNKGQQNSDSTENKRKDSFVAQKDNLKSYLMSEVKNDKIEESAIKANLIDYQYIQGKIKMLEGVAKKVKKNKKIRLIVYSVTSLIYVGVLIALFALKIITTPIITIVVTAMGFLISFFEINILNERFSINEDQMRKNEMEKYNLEYEGKRIGRLVKYAIINENDT